MSKLSPWLVPLAFACVIPLLAFATVPSGEKLNSALEAPLKADPDYKTSTSLSTSPVPAIDTDVVDKTDNRMQLLVVSNLDASNLVCVGSTSWNGADTCSTRCTATSINCTIGSANMKSVIPVGAQRQFRYTNDRCVCVVGSAAGTDILVERVVR